MNNFSIGIVGNGFVGRATSLFKCRDIDVLIYDKRKDLCSEGVTKVEDLFGAELIFICLPTPMEQDGSCHTEIVESAILEIRQKGYKGSVIVRSTVPVGFSEKNLVGFMPEFLTEANWPTDFKNTSCWIISGNNQDVTRLRNLINIAFDNSVINTNLIDILTTKEAELLKYVRNCFLATKVSFFNEIYQFCKVLGIDYNHLMESVLKDDRIGRSHTKVPGPDGYLGRGGSCLVKDMFSLSCQMKKFGTQPIIIDAANLRNSEIDRKEKDWNSLIGRAVI